MTAERLGLVLLAASLALVATGIALSSPALAAFAGFVSGLLFCGVVSARGIA